MYEDRDIAQSMSHEQEQAKMEMAETSEFFNSMRHQLDRANASIEHHQAAVRALEARRDAFAAALRTQDEKSSPAFEAVPLVSGSDTVGQY